MKIQKATKEDLKEIVKLMMRVFSKPPCKEKFVLKDASKSLKFYFKLGHIYIVVDDKKIIGVVVFKIEQYWEGKVVIIEDLAVDENFQKKGAGGKLIKFVEDYAKRDKIKGVLFSTNKKSPSLNFYKKLRYKQYKNTIFMGKKLG